ncbi:toxin-antitoxin system HicB family antitoxin [Pseudonocardia sp. TRM90224]|uniref:toxin-antitoxin system HicB family antitoxin n=1 Tax=Pseudonocardia sp. TRM90224 TaxID=2812678 RepID=UPI001E541873|nr:toxin-antitoxin system HicB family antitoxin [Pseudonocardia sp. TRM90224]
MDLGPYIATLRNELAGVAEAGGAERRELAERLVSQLESATRLTMLDVLSAAAEEITRDMVPGSVQVRLQGRNARFVVTTFPQSPRPGDPMMPAAPSMAPSVPAVGPVPDGGDGGTSRINLRLPEHLKARVDVAATAAGLSVNAWLVRAVAATLDGDGHEQRRAARGTRGANHLTRWAI